MTKAQAGTGAATGAATGIAMIGFGEAGQAFATGWASEDAPARAAFDIKSADPAAHAGLAAKGNAIGVVVRETREAALAGAGRVFCLVTADRALAAAQECAPLMAPGAYWFDGNSCAPDTKRTAAAVIEAAGGRYVDMAIMAPVHPRLHRTPVLLAGPHAEAAAPVLAGLGMNARAVGPEVGNASSVKMLRSVMVKGIEALTAECLLAARKAGVEAEVLASLQASETKADWSARGAYNLERMMRHGLRRAAEMREVVVTLQNLGFDADVTSAVADWHQRIGEMGLEAGPDDVAARADGILGRL